MCATDNNLEVLKSLGIIAGAVNKKVKALQLMKDLYLVQDQQFVGAVRAHSTPFISEMLEYRCEPHPRYGDKPMMRVRKLARYVFNLLSCASRSFHCVTVL